MHPSLIKHVHVPFLVQHNALTAQTRKVFDSFVHFLAFVSQLPPPLPSLQILWLYQVLNVIAKKIINYFYSLHPQAMISRFPVC